MRRTIRLLGRPVIEVDGREVARPRGNKPWGVLAYLALSEQPPTRRRVAALLFPDADDPLGAVRWSLAQLRRGLDDAQALRGDPPGLGLRPGDTVDVDAIAMDVPRAEGPAELPGGDLLEGMEFGTSPAFEMWLAIERQRLAAAAEALLREASQAALAAGAVDAAVRSAVELVQRNPLDDGHQELAVRCLARAGHREAALRQVAACEDLFRRELGVPPSPAVRRAAEAVGSSPGPAVGSATAVETLLEAGEAAVAAGAVDEGVASLRRACSEAAACDDARLRAVALLTLASTLFHTMRGSNEEAAACLHDAIAAATAADHGEVLVAAQRQLAFIDARAGRHVRALRWLREAGALATSDAERAGVLLVRGMVASDTADYPAAFAVLDEATGRARACGDDRTAAFALSLIARAHLLRGEVDQATAAVEASLEATRRLGWLAFRPWPETVLAEAQLEAGDAESAAHTAEHAFSLACHVGDPCWEGLAARVLGRISVARGDVERAWGWLDEARGHVTRAQDPYRWATGHVLDAICALAVTADRSRASQPLAELTSLAARHGLRELTVRAGLHRSALDPGDGQLSTALVVGEIDNPSLAARLADQRPEATDAAAARKLLPSRGLSRGRSPGR